MPTVLDRVAEFGVVPVIAIDSVAHALPLADALLAGGLPVVEITFRTAAAAEVIRLLAKERPALIVGAGTVLSPETVQTAVDAGARVEAGLELGCKLLKFFPAEALGGTQLLSALSAPYKHTGVRFMPTGGASPANLATYLKIDTVAAVGGTWIAKKEDMAEGRWDAIAQRCREARAIVAAARGQKT